MAGTYILTDTINQLLRGRSSRPPARATTWSSRRPRRSGRERTLADLADHRSDARAGARRARRRGGRGRRSSRPATILDTHGKRLSTGGAPAFVASTVPAALRVLRAGRRPLPRRPERGRDRRGDRTTRGAEDRPADASSRARRPPSATRSSASCSFGGGESFGGAGAALLTPGRGPARRRRARPLRPDRRRRASAA